jgi:hypothetical protein
MNNPQIWGKQKVINKTYINGHKAILKTVIGKRKEVRE